MKTLKDHWYKIKNKELDRYLGTRSNGKNFWKLWPKNASEIEGGAKLNKVLKDLNLEAVEV